jgi:serine/threonine protein kinase
MEPGYKIEHFVIVEKIGQGGQAEVWSAQDERLKRTVAVKTIGLSAFSPHVGGTATGTIVANASMLTSPEKFREEAHIIAALEHPNILPVYAFGQEGDYLYIVMRYMPSGTLRDLIRRSPLEPHEAVALLEPLASAIDLAHKHDIIHRDIKSVNVLLDAQLHPYLADFGLSMARGSTSGSGVGTLGYMAPEQITGGEIDHRSDLFAFGILMYELLTNELPMAHGQVWTLIYALQQESLPTPSDMAPAIANVLMRAMAYSPEDRYQSATEAVAALKQVVGDTLPSIQREPEITDPTLLALKEARDLFNKAQERWADGSGRFRFEVGDYKYVESYYANSDLWDISLDGVAKRLMLRGALEHDHNIDYWWKALDMGDSAVEDRRAVTLQTLTSDNASARQRAMHYLANVEDSTPAAIPIRVANVIASDPDPAVQIAGITLLEKRAVLASKSDAWQPIVYGEFVDTTLAQLAVQDRNQDVAQAAARAVARLRSGVAVDYIVRKAQKSPANKSAFEALVTMRDELPALPATVPANLRQWAFAVLSWRQLIADPLALITQYASAAAACALMIGIWAFVQFNDQKGLLAAQRAGNALAAGVLYGALTGVGIFAAITLASRLKAWHVAGRIPLALIVGALLTTVAFVIQVRLFRFYTPQWTWLLGACVVFVAGFATAPAFTRRPSILSLAGSAGVLIALYASMRIGQEPLLYLFDGSRDSDMQNLAFSAILAAIVGLVTFLPMWIKVNKKVAN